MGHTQLTVADAPERAGWCCGRIDFSTHPEDGLSMKPTDSIALGNRAHFTARPVFREELIRCFSSILGCGPPTVFAAPGMAATILAFRFPGGGSLSIELSDDALDESSAGRGAWLEIRTDDVAGLTQRIIEAGLRKVEYPATTTFYFAAPGGQVFGVIDLGEPQASRPAR